MTKQPRLDDLLKPGQPLPPDEVMIAKALEILEHSPHGSQLVEFAKRQNVQVKIIATPQQTGYLPDSKMACLGFSRNNPMTPARFIVTLAGLLRESQQEHGGLKHLGPRAPLEEHMKTSFAKQEDKLWHMFTVACELDDQAIFKEYKLLDELRKMGHNESLELYLKQERKN